MAISKSIQLSNGILINDAYIRVTDIALISKDGMFFNASYFVDNSQTEPAKITRHGFTFDLDGGNPYVQAYEHLKTLPEFTDAVDC